jgi:hypothetical protein
VTPGHSPRVFNNDDADVVAGTLHEGALDKSIRRNRRRMGAQELGDLRVADSTGEAVGAN